MFHQYAYSPRTHQIFWCNICDAARIDSQKEDTGSFYVVHGHGWDDETKEYDGDYHGIMFAVCKNCQSA